MSQVPILRDCRRDWRFRRQLCLCWFGRSRSFHCGGRSCCSVVCGRSRLELQGGIFALRGPFLHLGLFIHFSLRGFDQILRNLIEGFGRSRPPHGKKSSWGAHERWKRLLRSWSRLSRELHKSWPPFFCLRAFLLHHCFPPLHLEGLGKAHFFRGLFRCGRFFSHMDIRNHLRPTRAFRTVSYTSRYIPSWSEKRSSIFVGCTFTSRRSPSS